MVYNKDKRCAPSKIFEDGSCFTLENLKYISNQINNYYYNYPAINTNTTKKVLMKEIIKFFKDNYKCDSQLCWFGTDVFKSFYDSDIYENTFRPTGPDKGTKWLSNYDINKCMKQYEKKYKNFLFFDAVPDDFANLHYYKINNYKNGKNNYNELWDKLKNKEKYKIGIIFNTDTSSGRGQHWNSLYFNLITGEIYFFDSTSAEPSENVKKFINILQSYFTLNNIKSYYKYNKFVHQRKNSECGVYSMNFIIRILNGETFENITRIITKDDDMNLCRSKYFT